MASRMFGCFAPCSLPSTAGGTHNATIARAVANIKGKITGVDSFISNSLEPKRFPQRCGIVRLL
jgi:hypothetical protein